MSIGLAAIIALAGLLLLVRVKFEGPDLGDGLSAMLNQRMRGRIAIGSVDWPMSALKTAVTGGWVAVTMRDVEVYDDKDEPVLVTPRITADLDLHALMFGRHDFVLRNIEVTGGRVLLREISDPYPLHDYDKTVFSILAAFYSKRSAAGYYVGVQATTAPLFDLQNYRLHDVDVDIRMTPYGKDDTSYQVRALLEDLNVSGGFLYMDSSDPLVPKFYFSLKPEAAGGEIDLFYEPRAAGGYTSTYQIPIKSLKVNSLAQLPAAWPTSSVANTLTFDVDITTADDAVMHVGGAMRDYWVDAYDGTWDVVATVKNAGPMLRHTFDPDLGGDNVTVAATITGPIVAYPKIAATLTGLTYNVTLVEPPLLLELETLKVEYDLVVDRGSVEEFVARGAGGKVKISGTFGGDGSDEAPFKVDGQVDIEEAVDLRGRMPPCLEQAFGSEVSGHLRVHRDKGDTALNVVVEDFVLDIGRLTVSGGSVFSDIAFGAINLDAVRLQFQHTNGLVWGSVNTATGKLDLDADARSGDIGGLVNQLNCATPKPKPARKEVQGRPGLAIAPRRTSRPPTVTPRARAVAAAPTAARAPVQAPGRAHSTSATSAGTCAKRSTS